MKDSEYLKGIKGFILAAGYSTRLRPITEQIPKPLMPVAGEVLLEYIFKNLNALTTEIGINLHYKAEEIEDYIKKQNLSLKTFYEEEILLTGGALWNAKEFLKDSVFIVHNGDIYSDANIKEAVKWHIENENSITLLVHDYKPHNKLIVDEDGNLLGVGDSDESHLAFSGIAIYSAYVLELLPEGPSSVIDLWLKAIKNGCRVSTFKVKYSFWFDIGTPGDYASAVFDKLKRNFSSLYIHPSASGCELIEPEGKIVIERDVKITKPFKGKNIIILPETEFKPENDYLSNLIIGKNFMIPFETLHIETLTSGGSDRKYLRENNKVFCTWEKLSEDFEKTIVLNEFFHEKAFPVPKILEVDINKKTIVFEDLGDLTLYSWFQCKRTDEEIETLYKNIVEDAGKLHWKISKEATDLNLPEFDYSYFLWESDYFLKECVREIFKVEETPEEDFHMIAEILSKAQKVILHRDLQSQNIILKNRKIYFVDYQSARWGPAGYDIASLLWDPYVKLKDEIRIRLVNFYIKSHELDEKAFLQELSLCRIQRHMQALGAYGFLSLKKGKRNFLKFIPYAIDLLEKDIEECHINLSGLKNLVFKIKKHLVQGCVLKSLLVP
ncbi:sugar phosphate nucleotidyltransferase [Thermodesulfovibrio sp. 3907-1M]|uniref:Sugar phosphate nucleotidyltransferase n=1 Tax=Thermodesulfovibrio autotrophicus TaxID=3118333 RepID=A0AAU8H0T9_9BACT